MAPYVDYIDVIGLGNHEVSVLKYHHIDLVRFFWRSLIGDDPALPPIQTRRVYRIYRYLFPGRIARISSTLIFSITTGQGGNAEVTGRIIDAKRRLYTRDLIWLGHKHKRWAVEIDPEEG